MSTVLATYRLQLEPELGFDDAAALADYLVALGVSHVYCSPYLQAAAGSTHGYDVVDPHRVNRELGGAEAHARFCEALARHGLGQVLDIVPNHMAIGTGENRWWWDVLQNGVWSPYADYFDVDWDAPDARSHNRILLPVLADQYGSALEAGELQLGRDGMRFAVHYRESSFPLTPRSLDAVLAPAARRVGTDALAFLADAFGRLPAETPPDRESLVRYHRDKRVLEEILAGLLAEGRAAAAVDESVGEINGDRQRLHALLEQQHYRLAHWRMARRDLGYRRFFDINDLVGLRVEDARVFADTHELVIRWLDDGTLDGVRIDHPDGLRDPEVYLYRLRGAAPRAWIVLEKILEGDERLPASWPADGTTGYDFLNLVGGLFVDPAGAQPLTAMHAEVTGDPTTFGETAREAKLQVLRDLLGSDVRRLAALLLEICERHLRHRDHTQDELEEVLREVIACFPVYRTYFGAHRRGSEEDARRVDAALEGARTHRPDLDPALLAFVGRLLRLEIPDALETELALRFQQLTGPAMAKGVEDTAFYRFHRLASLNEVGGDPDRFGVSPPEFHGWCEDMHQRFPATMLSTSTHDTKRSEDVRARLALLSEIPAQWATAVARWRERSRPHRRSDRPDVAAEYLLYQTLVGAWPIAPERAVAYMEKAAREAKRWTSWRRPDRVYEAALRSFVEAVMADSALLSDIESFVTPLIQPGRINSLAQLLLKLAAPGVPDLYRGTELWDLSLVDPDNRRPVDWELRRRLLRELDGLGAEEVWRRADESLPKLWVIQKTLALRRRLPAAFGAEGHYRPLVVRGSRAQHAVAFSRSDAVAAVVPRLVLGLDGDWSDTSIALPAAGWHNQLTGERLDGGATPLATLLARFPVALLSREDAR